MSVERLRGLMWRDKMELRLKGYASRRAAEEDRKAASRRQLVKVVIVQLADVRATIAAWFDFPASESSTAPN